MNSFTSVLFYSLNMSSFCAPYMTLKRGDIVKINPGVSTNFEALTDVTTVVVKYPGTINDKYIC